MNSYIFCTWKYMNSYKYEFILCTNSYIFCSYHVRIHIFLQCKLKAASARNPRARAASAQRKPWGRSPSSPPAPTRPRPIFVDPILFIYNRIKSDQNIQFQFYMQHRSNFIWLSHHVISDSVFLNRQQIHSERKTKKIERKQKHLDPILHGFCTI
jgi:hypothetical protein